MKQTTRTNNNERRSPAEPVSQHQDAVASEVSLDGSFTAMQRRQSDFIGNSTHQATQGALGARLNATPRMAAQRRQMDALSAMAAQRAVIANAEGASPAPVRDATGPANRTGLPDGLKSGMENLSGMAMDDVRVHYNSDKPAQLQAHAYAQGTDIHVAPGQERYLPHEAWHVVQQAQGRVKPTVQRKDAAVNDDASLESEADAMGAKALNAGAAPAGVHTASNGRQATAQSVAQPVAQRYAMVDLDSAQKWEEVRHAFTAIRPQLEQQGSAGKEHFIMRYVEGPPVSSKLKVSDAGNLAVNGDGESQHTVFFLASGLLAKSNQELDEANSDFTLSPTGVMVVVNNHPEEGNRKTLLQVEAKPRPDKGATWARDLDTRCNVYFKNITRAHDGFEEILTTTPEENKTGEISAERRGKLDNLLATMTLKAGDAFEIKALGANSPGFGWNEHYAGIVAVDGGDQIALENYNRESEFGEKVIAEATNLLGMNGQQIDSQLSALRKQLGEKWFWEKEAKATLRTRIEQTEALRARWMNIMSKSKRDEVPTHHFKIYGPASKGQSFLDMWRGDMEKQQSKLSTAKARREE